MREERKKRKDDNKIIKILPFLSICFHFWDYTVHSCQIFWHLKHLIWVVFWYLVCQMPNILHLTHLMRMLLYATFTWNIPGMTWCAFGLRLKIKIILLFSLFLLLFIDLTALFGTIHMSHYIISTNFYFYLQ